MKKLYSVIKCQAKQYLLLEYVCRELAMYEVITRWTERVCKFLTEDLEI